mmetsp:Transcript_8560/g.12524  ORF Transcript_8560/g.12524 Transcript_8560/m.12524 type:complete len:85 (-) Transcript_8560:25-279(-)
MGLMPSVTGGAPREISCGGPPKKSRSSLALVGLMPKLHAMMLQRLSIPLTIALGDGEVHTNMVCEAPHPAVEHHNDLETYIQLC